MKSTTITAIIALISAACVTVNIYFPAAAAEQAADQIIQDIYGRPKKDDAPEKPPNESRGVDVDTSLGGPCVVFHYTHGVRRATGYRYLQSRNR